MKYLLLFLMATLLLISGCSMFTTDEQAKLDDGRLVYIDGETGKATTAPAGADGLPNAPLMFSKPADWIGEATSLGGSVPTPWGGILGGIFGLLGSGIGVYTGFRNKKNKGLLAELITSVEKDPAALKAVKELDHSAALKETVANVTAGAVKSY